MMLDNTSKTSKIFWPPLIGAQNISITIYQEFIITALAYSSLNFYLIKKFLFFLYQHLQQNLLERLIR